MTAVERIVKNLAICFQYPEEDVWQIYYEGKLEPFLIKYFQESHMIPDDTRNCDHFGDVDVHFYDYMQTGIDLNAFWLNFPGWVPKYTFANDCRATFLFGDDFIFLTEDDGYWFGQIE